MKSNLSLSHLLLAILVSLVWGVNFVSAKIALEILPIYTLLFLRMVILTVILFPFYRKIDIEIKTLFKISICFTLLHLGCMYISLRMGINSSIAVLVQQLSVPFLIILGNVFFKEKITKKLLIGITLSFVGLLILLKDDNLINNKFAFILMIGSAFFVSYYSIMIKNLKCNPMSLITWVSIASIPTSFLMAIIFEDITSLANLGSIEYRHIFAIIYTCILPSICGHGIWYYLLSKNSINSLSPILLSSPLFGVIASILINNENISLKLVIGGMLIILGVAFSIIKKRNNE